MPNVLPHHWLEIQSAGETARSGRTLGAEERDLLNALRSTPLRVVDLFRRLRWADGHQFQELIQRALHRGWLAVHDHEPSQLPSAATVHVQETDGSDALQALLERYGGDAELDRSDSEPANPALPDPSELLNPAPPVLAESLGPAPWERLPPGAPATADNASELWRAMGVDNPPTETLDTAHPERGPLPEPEGLGGGAAGLLQMLLRQDASIGPAVVDVPAYGLGPGARPTTDESDAFVRLRDVGAVWGPGDHASGASSPPSGRCAPSPPLELEAPTARTRHRLAAREQMLAAARREAADRQAARERAQSRQAKQEAAEAQRRTAQSHQKAREQAESQSRAADFLERAARAKRIRDGLPSDPPV